MAKRKPEVVTLEQLKDRHIGRRGTARREEYENALRMDLLAREIRSIRKARNLTQEQLGKMVGVQKAQISKLESHANSATIDTLLRVFDALKTKIYFRVER